MAAKETAKALAVLTAVQAAIPVAEFVLREAPKIHGFIHKRVEAEINGIHGFLVWDYIAYNEITFDDDKGNVMSFFTSISDKETEARWNELIDMYGINKV